MGYLVIVEEDDPRDPYGLVPLAEPPLEVAHRVCALTVARGFEGTASAGIWLDWFPLGPTAKSENADHRKEDSPAPLFARNLHDDLSFN